MLLASIADSSLAIFDELRQSAPDLCVYVTKIVPSPPQSEDVYVRTIKELEVSINRAKLSFFVAFLF